MSEPTKNLPCGCRVATERDFLKRVIGRILERAPSCADPAHETGAIVIMPGREHARPE